jgi:glutaredoxin
MSLVLVTSPDCRLCDRARAVLAKAGVSYREIDLATDEAGDLARAGVPVVFFPVLVDGTRVLAYGDFTGADVQVALEALA